MNNGLLTVIEITDTHVKVLQGMPQRGSALVTFWGIREISGPSDEAVSKALSSLVTSSKLVLESVVGVIPRRFAILRHLSLPSQSEEEIHKMVQLQVSKQIPYPKEDVVLDYTTVRKEPNGYSKVLVIAVHKEVIGRYLKIFESAGIGAQRLTLSSAGILNWYLFERGTLKEKSAKPELLIHIDQASSEICFCHQDKLLFSRHLNFGVRDLAKESMTAFLEEVGLTIETYMKENISGETGQMTLVSSSPDTSLLKARLEADYKIPVRSIAPFDHVSRKKDSKMSLADQTGVSPAVGIGLLLETRQKFINLMPVEISDRQAVRAKQKEWVKFSLLFLCLSVLAVSVFAARLYKNTTYLGHLAREVKEMEPSVNTVKDKMKRLDFIKERMNPGISAIDIIRELYQMTPAEVSFNIIHLDESGTLNLQGVSQTGAAVGVFQRNLVNSTLLRNVNLQYVTKRKIFNGELNDFKITCQVGRDQKDAL